MSCSKVNLTTVQIQVHLTQAHITTPSTLIILPVDPIRTVILIVIPLSPPTAPLPKSPKTTTYSQNPSPSSVLTVSTLTPTARLKRHNPCSEVLTWTIAQRKSRKGRRWNWRVNSTQPLLATWTCLTRSSRSDLFLLEWVLNLHQGIVPTASRSSSRWWTYRWGSRTCGRWSTRERCRICDGVI